MLEESVKKEKGTLDFPEPEKRKKRGGGKILALLAGFGILGCAAAYGAWMYYSIQTPSALIESGLLTLAAQTPAQVAEVLVKKNDRVQAGQALVRFSAGVTASDAAEIRAQSASVRNLLPPPADMEDVARRIADAQTAEQDLVGRIMQARALEEEAARDVQGKAEEHAKAQLELRRLDLLAMRYSIPGAQHEQARGNEHATRQKLEKARARREEYSRMRAAVDGELYRIKTELAGLKTVSGQTRAAGNTGESGPSPQASFMSGTPDIVAPVDAVVTDIFVQPGLWARPNQQVVALMPDAALMEATAWFSEKDGAAIQPGQICRVFIMELPEKAFPGRVEEVLPAGSLPPKPPLVASAQARHIPVRVRFSVKDTGRRAELKPGMRAAVRIHKFTPSWMRSVWLP